MATAALNSNFAETIGTLSYTTPQTGLPSLTAGIWLSLNEKKHAQSYAAKHLRALGIMYTHCQKRTGDPLYLDKIVMKGDIDAILGLMRSFVAERQNIATITGKDQTLTVRLATSVLHNVLDEIRYRNSDTNFDSAKITRSLAKLDSLYRFLRPPRASKTLRVRSLPPIVLNELFETLRPKSNSNPFRTEKLRQRNFIAFALLYQMGLRRGELLNLKADCMKAGYDQDQGRDIYWLDITLPQILDLRVKKPQLKNEYSPRQIPLSRDLYTLLLNFVSNQRGRVSHGFLFSSQKGKALSERGLNDICARLAVLLSSGARQELLTRCGTKTITPHNFRHSAAVDRIRAYRHSGVEMSSAEAMMRVFFGWSPSSKMPVLYARAYYEEQLNTTWLKEFDNRVTDLMGYE